MTRHRTPTKEASLILREMEDDYCSIGDYAALLAILSEGTEISDAAVPGFHRISWLIRDHAQAVHDKTEQALQLLREADPALSLVSG